MCEFTADFALKRSLHIYWTEQFLSAERHRKLNKFSNNMVCEVSGTDTNLH